MSNQSNMSDLWKRLRFVFFAILVYRIGTHIPIPGIDPDRLAALFQQIGLVTTTATNAGFFTSLYVLLVPIIGIFLGSVPHFSLWLAVLICIIGSVLLAIPEGSFMVEKINKGDIWVILGSLLWALHVQVLSYGVKKNPIMLLAILQFLFASIVLIIFGFLFSPKELFNFPNLFVNPLVLITLLYCSIGSVCIAFVLQMIGQRYSPPNEAAIIMSTEAVSYTHLTLPTSDLV